MRTVNMFEAKTNLSRLVDALEQGEETEIIIARAGKPAARLVPLSMAPSRVRLGIAQGAFIAPEPDPSLDADIARLFGVE